MWAPCLLQHSNIGQILLYRTELNQKKLKKVREPGLWIHIYFLRTTWIRIQLLLICGFSLEKFVKNYLLKSFMKLKKTKDGWSLELVQVYLFKYKL